MNHLQISLPLELKYLNINDMVQHPCPQNFDFSYPLIKYFLNYSTGESWKKLIQTCKYFFSKKSIYPIGCLKAFGKLVADGEFFDLNKAFSNIWLYNECCTAIYPKKLSLLIARIAKCDLRKLNVTFGDLTWEEYKILTTSGVFDSLELSCSTIKYSDGTMVTCDKLFDNFSYLKKFVFRFHRSATMFEPDTVEKIVNILPRFTEMRCFALRHLPESFDISSFIDFIMKNSYIDIELYYGKEQLSDAYSKILDKIIDDIIATPPKKIPKISYQKLSGIRFEKYSFP